jgi:DedD protein
MRQVFDEREVDETERGYDREITLGATGLIAICAGLILVCGLFFGLGYAAGHRAPAMTLGGAQPAQSSGSLATAADSRSKPSALPAPEATPAAGDASTGAPPSSTDPDGDIVNGGSTPSATAGAAQPSNTPTTNPSTVRPALQAQPMQSAAAPVAGAVAPAMVFMVQIAAVSHAEDASVLTNALLRRGYAVTARRDPSDNLIHVRVGPFNTHNDADAMRLKLLNDGYNAVIEP